MKTVLKTLLIAVIGLFISSCGVDDSGSELSSKKLDYKAGVLLDLGLLQFNVEEGPAIEYRIFGRALLGSNKCNAKGVKAELQQQRHDGFISVTLMKEYPSRYDERICTTEYAPVYKDVSITVHLDRTEYKYVIIKNVDVFGVNVRADSLID